MKFLFLALLAISTFSNTACESRSKPPEQWKQVPLPDLSSPVILDVAYVNNPRFRSLDESQLKNILQQSQIDIKDAFAIDVVFRLVDSITIDEFFNYLGEDIAEAGKNDIVDITAATAHDEKAVAIRKKMQAAIAATLENYAGSEQDVVDYAQPYLLNKLESRSLDELSRNLVDTLLARLVYWQDLKAEDNKPVLDNRAYNEWVWWDSMGYGDMPYDVVITNQLVASAELYGMDVHSSLRGGITAGTTTYSRLAKYNSYVYVMLYPMLNDNTLLEKLKGDRQYSAEQITNYAAALLTHEIGHLLLHLGHPFGNDACVMSPTPLLRYRSWYESLDASRCLLGSTPAMTPGAAKIEYRSSW